MRRECVLAGSAIGLPIARPVGAEEAGARALHQPGGPARHHLIVIVVLPEIAERVDRQLVGVAEVVGDHREARAVGLHPQTQPSSPHPPIVAHHAALILQVVRRAAGVEAAGTKRPPRSVGHDMRAGVAGVEVPTSIRSSDECMQPVVVIETAESGQQDLLLVRRVVAVRVGVDDQVRRRRDHDAVADHGKAEWRAEILVLHEDLGRVRPAVAVRVAENQNPVSRVMGEGTLLGGIEAAVVDRFGHPDTAANVHVDIRRVEEHRRFRPKGNLEIVGEDKLITASLRPRATHGPGKGEAEQNAEHAAGHGRRISPMPPVWRTRGRRAETVRRAGLLSAVVSGFNRT